jgi:hypothetical protein
LTTSRYARSWRTPEGAVALAGDHPPAQGDCQLRWVGRARVPAGVQKRDNCDVVADGWPLLHRPRPSKGHAQIAVAIVPFVHAASPRAHASHSVVDDQARQQRDSSDAVRMQECRRRAHLRLGRTPLCGSSRCYGVRH